MTLRPTGRSLLANVTASDPLAVPMKSAVVKSAALDIQRLRVLGGDQQEEQREGQKISLRNNATAASKTICAGP